MQFEEKFEKLDSKITRIELQVNTWTSYLKGVSRGIAIVALVACGLLSWALIHIIEENDRMNDTQNKSIYELQVEIGKIEIATHQYAYKDNIK